MKTLKKLVAGATYVASSKAKRIKCLRHRRHAAVGNVINQIKADVAPEKTAVLIIIM
ncbi:MAG: hypothetical protein R3C11_18580 [Planctomycetaceae bacterium]